MRAFAAAAAAACAVAVVIRKLTKVSECCVAFFSLSLDRGKKALYTVLKDSLSPS